jgi:hypothetical protein
MAAIDRPEVGAGMSDIDFWDNAPLPVCALLAFTILDQRTPVRLDEQGYEISEACSLSDLFSPEDAAAIERWMRAHFAHDQICDECGIPMGEDVPLEDLHDLEPQHIFSLTTSGIKSFFICDWCREKWACDEDAGLPNIMAKL